MKLDPEKFKQPERYTQPHPYLPVRVGRKGEVFSQPKTDKPVKVLKPQITRNGYELVGIYVEGKKKKFLVHRLVWETYNQQAVPDGFEVNHIDENKRNNCVWNLNLMTRKENVNWATGHARSVATRRNDVKRSKPVLQIDLQNNVVKEWPSVMEVERQMGWYNSYIGKACRGECKTAYGFKWRYK